MRKFFSRLIRFLEQQSPYRLWGIILLSIVILGILDNLTGFELSFSLFFVLPVSLTAWTMGKKPGYFICMISGIVWLVANLLAGGEEHTNAFIPYWNASVRTGFFIIVTFLLAELRQALDFEKKQARTDGLTEILNRRAFYGIVALELARIQRHPHPVTLLYVDVDNFKPINDLHGHQVGDHVLEIIAHTITQNIRTVDKAARLGGDEFAVLLPETDENAAKIMVSRLRLSLLAEMEKHRWPVTFSMGALTCRNSPQSVDEMIQQADQLMYEVKRASKDGIAYAVI